MLFSKVPVRDVQSMFGLTARLLKCLSKNYASVPPASPRIEEHRRGAFKERGSACLRGIVWRCDFLQTHLMRDVGACPPVRSRPLYFDAISRLPICLVIFVKSLVSSETLALTRRTTTDQDRRG